MFAVVNVFKGLYVFLNTVCYMYVSFIRFGLLMSVTYVICYIEQVCGESNVDV
jgi:hypothetical protein